MPRVGESLRRAREKRNLSIEQVAADTNIRKDYLLALEAENESGLPSPFYYRSFLRQYARFLEISPAQLDAAAREIVEPPPTPVNEDLKVIDPAAQEPFFERLKEALDAQNASLDRNRLPKRWALLVAVLILGCGVYLSWGQISVFFASRAETAANTRVTPPQSMPVNVPDANSPPAAPPVVGEKPGDGQFQISLKAKEDTWVRLMADGNLFLSDILKAGESKTINASFAVLTVGNAGGLDVSFNGRAIGEYGTKGQVRTILFKTDGWEIQRKKKDPDQPASASQSGPLSTTL